MLVKDLGSGRTIPGLMICEHSLLSTSPTILIKKVPDVFWSRGKIEALYILSLRPTMINFRNADRPTTPRSPLEE